MKIDNIPRGPARWERAALNAVRHPNTQAAKLYYARVANARMIADSIPRWSETPYQFMQFKWNGKHYTEDPGAGFNYTREYVVCSTYCMMMVAQLRACNARNGHGKGLAMPELTRVQAFINGEIRRWNFSHPITPDLPKYPNVLPLDVSELKRQVTCFCCGKKMGPEPKRVREQVPTYPPLFGGLFREEAS